MTLPVMERLTGRILVVDDEEGIRDVAAIALEKDGHKVETAPDAASALALMAASPFDMVVHDLRMPGMHGIELLRALRERWPDVPVAVLTAHGTAEHAIEAMRLGAFDFVTKPFDNDDLRSVAQRALLSRRLQAEGLPDSDHLRLIGSAPAMRELLALIRRISATDCTVAIYGESGTGKELVARLVHWLSPRREAPFIAVNCGGFSETLLESELFGHAKGAFTGAVADKKGLMELADGGTFFLDEVGEMTLSTQVRLLRALETRTFTPVGGTVARRVDLRFVAATNRDLSDMVARRTFREDLYYRLNVIPVRLPSLRERPEDIPLLAGHFLSLCNHSFGRSLSGFDAGAVAALKAHRWPGNVRELQNVIQRAASLATGPMVTAADIMHLDAAIPGSSSGTADGGASGGLPPLADRGFSLDDTLAAIEAKYLSEALDRTGGNLTQAADLLGVTFRSIRYKVQKLGLDRKGR